MIYEDSRYETATVDLIQGIDGVVRLTIEPGSVQRSSPFQYSRYTVVEGDRIDIIASKLLGDPELWWMIADVNPQRSFYDQIPPGTVLRIPSGLQSS